MHKEYYGDGRLKSAANSRTTRFFAYDSNKNLTRDQLTIDSRIFELLHTYNENDGLSRTTYPAGNDVAYSPNSQGRPTQLVPFLNSIDFHPLGEVKSLNFANGVSTSISITAKQWPYRLTTTKDSIKVSDMQYTYGGNGNVVGYQDFVISENTMPDARYDDLGRILQGDTTTQQRRFTYDGTGNITSKTIGSSTATYNYSNNLLRSISGGSRAYTFTYDSYGNVTANGTNTFRYNDAGQMTCAKCGLGNQITYAYDGLGMRVATTQNGITTYSLYDQAGQLASEFIPSNASGKQVYTDYFYIAGKQVATYNREGSGGTFTRTTRYLHNDTGGTPVASTDEIGGIVWRESYQPFGEQITKPADAQSNKQFFHDKPFDRDTQLSYFGARYYDPVVGRFMATDPVAFDESNPLHSFNRYAYGNNNPYKYKDPDGRFAWLIVPAVGFGLGMYITATATHQPAMGPSQNNNQGGFLGSGSPSSTRYCIICIRNEGVSGDKPSLLDSKGEKHILDGDENGGGGHRAGTGKPGKSEFPSSWSDDKIKGEISDIATDPNSTRTTQKGGRIKVQGTRDGVDITVIVEPSNRGGRIVTGFPTNRSRNP